MRVDRDKGLDRLISELLSFLSFKNGKNPLPGIDPGKRVKRGIWEDDGVDLTLLRKEGVNFDMSAVGFPSLEVEKKIVKEGLFRKRKEHVILVGMSDLGWVGSENAMIAREGDADGLAWVLSSDLLYPLGLCASFSLDEVLRGLTIERNTPRDPPRITQALVRQRLLSGEAEGSREDLKALFGRKVKKADWVRLKGGVAIKDLRTLISSVFDMRDQELEKALMENVLSDFSSFALKSTLLEGEIRNLSKDPNGEMESADNFRMRFGRWLMEGELGEIVLSDIVRPRLGLFRTCSATEGRRLERALRPLMDQRSSPDLRELLFEVPQHNRPHIISLMTATGDRSGIEPLSNLMEFSSVEEDREAAKEALKELEAGRK